MQKIFQSIWLNVLVALGVCSSALQASERESHLPPSLAIYKATHCNPQIHDADYVIVGLGTAGSVLARYLSDPVDGKFKNSVLVLESGQNYSNDPIILAGPDAFDPIELATNPKYAYTQVCKEENFPLIGLFGSVKFSTGRQWFGGSAHNYMAAVHGSTDRWDDLAAAAGNNQWSFNQLLPFFKFLETYNGTTTQPNDRGFSGPLQLTQGPLIPQPGDPFADALSSLTGAPILPDFNVPDGNTAVTAGQNYCTADRQTRSFGLDFLPPTILSPDGKGQHGRKLRVLSGAHAVKVVFDGDTAIGVEYYFDNNKDESLFVRARKQVILCAGAPFSAAILQRSGIGPSSVLQDPKVNVPVLVDNPLVGTGLKTHYGVTTAMTQPTVPFQRIFSFVDGRGFFAPAGSGDNLRRFQIGFEEGLVFFPTSILNAYGINPFTTPAIQAICWYLRPQSNGTAFIVDADPLTPPNILFNLYTDPAGPDSDLSASIAIFYMMQAFAHSIGSTMIFPPESHFSDPTQLAFDAGGLITFNEVSMTQHYNGTCAMGTDISNGVVSGTDLHVFGTKHLMVADNSIYPFPETGNTAWEAYVAGIMAAHILGFQLP